MYNLSYKVILKQIFERGGKFFYPLLFIFFSKIIIGQENYEFKGSIGAEYYKKNFTLKEKYYSNLESFFSKHLDLYFKSYFWNQKLLRYSLSVSYENGQPKNNLITGNISNLGYGVEIEFFPKSKNKFSFFIRNQNYNYDKSYGFNYERKTSGFGFSFFLNNLYAYYKNLNTTIPFYEEDERKQEEALLKKNFRLKKFQIFSELRRNSYDFKFFKTSQITDSAQFLINSPYSSNSNYNINLIFQNHIYEDKNFKIKQSFKFLNFSSNWNKYLSSKLQSILTIRGNKPFKEKQSFSIEEILRYQFNSNLKGDTILGYMKTIENEKEVPIPYGGFGIYYNKNFNKSFLYTRVGFIFKNKEESLFGGNELFPNFSFSYNINLKKISTGIEANYSGLSYHQFDISSEEIPPFVSEISQRTSKNYSLKYEFLFRDEYVYNISFKSLFNKFEIEYLKGNLSNFNSFLNQIDFNFKSLKFGFSYNLAKEENLKIMEIKTKETHLSFNIKANLAFQFSMLLRDKFYDFKGKDKEENAQFIYKIGKFSLKFWYQRLATSFLEIDKKINYFRIMLLRDFGTE